MQKQKDLFQHPEQWPDELTAVLEKYESEQLTYSELETMHKECESVGFTFDWYLDAVPYGLRKIGTPLESVEGFD